MKTLILLLLLYTFGTVSAQNVYNSETLQVEKLSDNTYIHTSYLPTEKWGKVACNGLIVQDNGEAVVVDTPVENEVSEELIYWIENNLKSKVVAVVPTHFHVDCIGGLKVFHDKNIMSVVHDLTQNLADQKSEMTFKDQYEVTVGNKKVVLYYPGEGHTKDNIIAYYEKDSVLFGGCLIKGRGAGKGNLADANVNEWSASVGKVKTMFPEVKHVVPGHGKAGGGELLDFTIKLFEDPIIIDESGKLIKQSEHPGMNPDAIYKVEANANRQIDYMINQFENKYRSISIAEKGNKVFEFLSIASSQNIDIEEINERRKKWITLCNAHLASKLVEDLYSKDGIYYNHKPVIRGHVAITSEYAYMNDPAYNLHLEPLTVVPINDQIVFEIGQCSGSYLGKYILVWKKEADDKWRIFMDSNI